MCTETELMKIVSLTSTDHSDNIMASLIKPRLLELAVSLSLVFVLTAVIIVLSIALCCCYYRQRKRRGRDRSTEKENPIKDDKGTLEVSILDSNKVASISWNYSSQHEKSINTIVHSNHNHHCYHCYLSHHTAH